MPACWSKPAPLWLPCNVESTLPYVSALLWLGIMLGCHYLAFRHPWPGWAGSLHEGARIRALGIALFSPLALLLYLQGSSPLLLFFTCQLLLYWLLSSFVRHNGLRVALLAAMTVSAGWMAPQYRDLLYALAATATVGWLLHKSRQWLWTHLAHHRLAQRLSFHAQVLVVFVSGYYLLRAWTVVPITSRQLRYYHSVLVLIGGLAAVEVLALVVERVLRSQQRKDSHFLSDALRAILYCLVALQISSGLAGRNLADLVVSSAFFSLGLGFALKPTLGNLVSGLIMRLSHDFAIGEFVRVGSIFGMVVRIDWRSVGLGTTANDIINITHSQVAKSVIVNYSRPTPQHGAYLELRLNPQLPPNLVRRQLLSLLAKIPQVLQHPEPEVYLMEMDGAGCLYRVRWWMDHIGHAPLHDSAVKQQLLYGLHRENLLPLQPIRVWHDLLGAAAD
jgi:small-conductance mechanosensitive channel